MSRRKLEVGADGKANVMLLTNPIPRHLSLVAWGANDRPTTSWKGAGENEEPSVILRSPPGEEFVDVAKATLESMSQFISETIDAWAATVAEVLGTSMTPAERGAQIHALSIQAGSRIAAMAVALSPKVVASAARTYKSAGLTLPKLPQTTTLQGELDRRRFMASFHEAAAAVTDAVLTVFSKADERMTESILESFSKAGDIMAQWAMSMPAGVVGVKPRSEQEPTAEQVVASLKKGARNSKSDLERMKKIRELLTELIGEEEDAAKASSTSPETKMLTIADLQKLAAADPKGFLEVVKTAFEAVKKSDPKVSMKVFWGETGVEPLDPTAIIGALRNMSDGTAIAALIASAVAGIDVGSKAEADNVQVAATMRSAFAKFVAHELETDPQGKLATAVKAVVAPSVAEALKSIFQGGAGTVHAAGGGSMMGGLDFGGENLADDESDPWTAQMPGQGRKTA